MTSLAPFGIAVGHATDADGVTGVTVVRGTDGPLRASAAVVGRATGTRELALLDPAHQVDRVDAIMLTGGSAYGLDAAAGVMRWMEERGRGWPVGIAHPLRPERRLAQVWLADRALGTSGSGVQYFHYRGRRLGHILDPRTGWPAAGVLSTTVLAPTARQADANAADQR